MGVEVWNAERLGLDGIRRQPQPIASRHEKVREHEGVRRVIT